VTATAVDWKAEVGQLVLAAGDQLVAAGLTRGLMCTADYDRPHGHAWLGARGASASIEVMAITPETSERVRREWPEYAQMLLPAGVPTRWRAGAQAAVARTTGAARRQSRRRSSSWPLRQRDRQTPTSSVSDP
jgi:hypothetical protein